MPERTVPWNRRRRTAKTASGPRAAGPDVVAAAGDERDAPTARVDRAHHGDVRQVTAASVGIVADPGLPRSQRVPPSCQQVANGLAHRAKLDANDALKSFATTLEEVCIETVEAGHMTKDLALLVGPEQPWLTTTGFLDKIDETLSAKLEASAQSPNQ